MVQDKNSLKVQALLEDVARLTHQLADVRADFTIASEERDLLRAENDNLKGLLDAAEEVGSQEPDTDDTA